MDRDVGARNTRQGQAAFADLSRTIRQPYEKNLPHARRDGPLANRRLSDLEPLLLEAGATRPEAAFYCSRGPCSLADRALQHTLPLVGQHRDRNVARIGRTSQYRRLEGLRRQSRGV